MLLVQYGGSIFIMIIASLMSLMIAMPFHEFAHAYAAKREGDYTAVALKRYTLGAFSHFDKWGFLFMFIFGFGWAKPVPIDTRNFKHGKKSEFRVAFAGILTNLLLGTVFLFIYMFITRFFPEVYSCGWYGSLLTYFLIESVSLNFMLAFFNLLPIYPLDGFRMVSSFCKEDNAFVKFMEKNSFFIYLIVAFTGLYSLYYQVTGGLLLKLLYKLFALILGLWWWKKNN